MAGCADELAAALAEERRLERAMETACAAYQRAQEDWRQALNRTDRLREDLARARRIYQ